MSAKKSLLNKRSLAAVIFCAVMISSVVMIGQTVSLRIVGVPDDWTHHRLVFSNPGTAGEALGKGRFTEWYKLVNEPRYLLQQMKHPLPGPIGRPPRVLPPSFWEPTTLKRDWSMDSGGVAVAASVTGTFSAEPSTNTTLTIKGNGSTLILTASTANSTSCTYTSGSSTVTFTRSATVNTNARNLATVINTVGCGSVVGVYASAPGASAIKITATVPGPPGNSITVLTSASTFGISAWDTTTDLAGGTPGAVAASVTGTFSAEPTSGTTLTIKGNGDTLILTASTANSASCTYTSNSASVTFTRSATLRTNATNLATVINTAGCGSVVGASAVSTATPLVVINAAAAGFSGNRLTVLASASTFGIAAWDTTTYLSGGQGMVGPGEYPAKYSFSTGASSANCSSATPPDYVVYNTGAAGASGTQANIIAYDNLYTGCSGTVPSVYWSYYTGTGSVFDSPVLSLDGTKVAFLETVASGAATLRILKFKGGEGTNYSAPVAPTNLYTNTYAGASGNTAWSTCPSGQSCLISVAFQTELNPDTFSAPFYDYQTDTLWVGDNAGYLHEFTGVFLGTPGEMTNNASGTCGSTCVWPILLASGQALTSPVYDIAHSLLLVGATGGKVYSVSATNTTDTIATSNQIGYGNKDIRDAPLVDPLAGTAGEVYVFVSSDTSGGGGNSGVFQFAEGSISASSGTEEAVGSGALSTDTTSLYAGAFDNAYLTSSNSASPTGNIWVCGDTGGNPTLYAVPITNNVMGAATAGPVVTGSANVLETPCSPVTEFYNSTTSKDYIFVSPETQSTTPVTGCTASVGCVISYTVSGTTATAVTGGAGAFPGGASGMIVDNLSTSPTGLQLYFSNLNATEACAGNGTVGSGTGGCAIQASQTAP